MHDFEVCNFCELTRKSGRMYSRCRAVWLLSRSFVSYIVKLCRVMRAGRMHAVEETVLRMAPFNKSVDLQMLDITCRNNL